MASSDVMNTLELGSNVTSENERFDKTRKLRSRIFFFIIIVIFVLYWCLLLSKLVFTNNYKTQEVGISLPDHWFYERQVMGMPECRKSVENVTRNVVKISHIDRQCGDIQDCVNMVRTIAASANFFITIGHVFEGLGWHCNATESISIKFVGVLDEFADISFYKLLKIGLAYSELTEKPIIIVDTETCKKFTCPLI